MGGDPIPTPWNPEGVRDIATETSLLLMIRSLKDLEGAIRAERKKLTLELSGLRARKAEELAASAHVQDAAQSHKLFPEV